MGSYCTRSCFENRTSACCSKDGIITFWADVVINVLCTPPEEMNRLRQAIEKPHYQHKCIYLEPGGCTWKIKPLVCAMFVCDPVQEDVIKSSTALNEKWIQFVRQAKTFRWPDRPVLFDRLEEQFMAMGCQSELMYINTSPGLLRVKQRAGLLKKRSKKA